MKGPQKIVPQREEETGRQREEGFLEGGAWRAGGGNQVRRAEVIPKGRGLGL